ncbi:undecaprenyl/decaprenyl-phosphate alpha-N-acetylglucosaminyl 1-phosphate transferase [Streptomyces sp. HYC2]|uniref:MraY family glycosyltransferase n=1 Tax=Streptomyces sp. HYC2 TaxID=2955207 RepID=UPI002480F566|nr:undecaprenyl/decaprenyl-phosphate alpha-N-acetylglucosaminyl 1-phosphate transferase [Streptomyces sp. HYC2]
MLYGITTAITALLLAALLSALLRVLALRLGLVDRRRRARPLPLLGGLAVVLSTCLVAAAGGWTGTAPLGDGVGRLLTAGAAVAVLGTAADVWRLKTPFLFVGTALAAACVVPYDEIGPVAWIAAVAWIACVAAAFRGLDHADGLAGTVGVLTAFGVGVCAAAEVMDDLAVLLSVLAAALTGFLMHNWHPARVAFGSGGSLFTGFVLASAALLTRTGYDTGSTVAVLFALTATASADAVLVLVSRKLAGRPLLRRGPDHFAHRLRRLGPTPPGATVLLGLATFAAVLVGVLVHTGWAKPTAVLWVAGAALAVVLGLLRVPAYAPRRHTEVNGARAQTPGSGTRTQSRVPGTRGQTRVPGTRGRPEERTARGLPVVGGATRARADASGSEGPPRVRGDASGARSRAEPFRALRALRQSGAGAPGAPRGRAPYDAESGAAGVQVPRRQLEYPPPPPRQSTSPQVRAPLRIRDG